MCSLKKEISKKKRNLTFLTHLTYHMNYIQVDGNQVQESFCSLVYVR